MTQDGQKQQKFFFVRNATGLTRSLSGWNALVGKLSANPIITVPTITGESVAVFLVVLGVVIYLASYFYLRSRGTNLNMIYAEIPPE